MGVAFQIPAKSKMYFLFAPNETLLDEWVGAIAEASLRHSVPRSSVAWNSVSLSRGALLPQLLGTTALFSAPAPTAAASAEFDSRVAAAGGSVASAPPRPADSQSQSPPPTNANANANATPTRVPSGPAVVSSPSASASASVSPAQSALLSLRSERYQYSFLAALVEALCSGRSLSPAYLDAAAMLMETPLGVEQFAQVLNAQRCKVCSPLLSSPLPSLSPLLCPPSLLSSPPLCPLSLLSSALPSLLSSAPSLACLVVIVAAVGNGAVVAVVCGCVNCASRGWVGGCAAAELIGWFGVGRGRHRLKVRRCKANPTFSICSPISTLRSSR